MCVYVIYIMCVYISSLLQTIVVYRGTKKEFFPVHFLKCTNQFCSLLLYSIFVISYTYVVQSIYSVPAVYVVYICSTTINSWR